MVVVMSDLITPCGRTSTGFSRVRHPELGRQQIRSAHVEILEDIVNESTIGGVDEQEARVEGVSLYVGSLMRPEPIVTTCELRETLSICCVA